MSSEGDLKKRITALNTGNWLDPSVVYEAYEMAFGVIDEAKKECPLTKLTDGAEYDNGFPTPEVMSMRRLELLIETYNWVKKYFGDLQ